MRVGVGKGVYQEFSYGSFRWLHAPSDVTVPGLSVARVTIPPRHTWPIHLHPNYEQVVHVVSGRGHHYVNGRRQALEPGSTGHIPMGSTHQITNDGDEPLVYLGVYNPVVSRSIREHEPERPTGAAPFYLREAVSMDILQQIQDKVAGSTGLGLLMADQNGRLLTRPTLIPGFCRMRCLGADAELAPPAIRSAMLEAVRRNQPYCGPCCLSVMIVAVPIVIEGHCAGTIACGFSLLNEVSAADLQRVRKLDRERAGELEQAYRDLEVVLYTRLQAAAEALDLITTTVVSLALDSRRQKDLNEANRRLLTETRLVADLEQDLSRMRLRILEAHLNPHFLFNSLSMISDLIGTDDDRARDVLFSLSDFLRYCLKETRELVPLSRELAVLDEYCRIQQARFGDKLQIEIKPRASCADALIPFMLLQPVVENSIVHGLSPRGYEGLIEITARRRQGRLYLAVRDNGVGFDRSVASSPDPGGFGFGLQSVAGRLEASFPGDGELLITSDPDRGTTVEIRMPLCTEVKTG